MKLIKKLQKLEGWDKLVNDSKRFGVYHSIKGLGLMVFIRCCWFEMYKIVSRYGKMNNDSYINLETF